MNDSLARNSVGKYWHSLNHDYTVGLFKCSFQSFNTQNMDKVKVEHKRSTVLVTGVSGYVGAHVAHQLILHGHNVRGTIRSISDGKINKLRGQILAGLQSADTNLPKLDFVEADLLREELWPQVVAGCKYVCHVASPFPSEVPRDPDTIIKPAVEGTLLVLRAAAKDGHVRRVVLTSSVAAIHDIILLDGKHDPDKFYNENDWVDENKVEPYSKSKILAERAAHKFIDELPMEAGKRKLELVVINPAFILGPMLTDSLSTSVLIVKRMLDKSMPVLPRFNLAICDVRDVALAHVKGVESSKYAGKRFLIVTESRWMNEMAKVVRKEMKPFGYWVPTMTVPNLIVRLSSLFDKTAVMIAARLGREFKLDNRRMVEELRITPTDPEKTIIDTCHSLIERGVVKPTRRYKRIRKQ